jgi:hypothetical protein
MMRMLFAALAALFLGNDARAYDGAHISKVDAAIVLAVDASGSVAPKNWWLQLRGYAEAFRSPDVLGAIRRGGRKAVAVTLVQWSGRGEQTQSVLWHRVHDAASAELLATKISQVGRLFQDNTCITDALFFSIRLLKEKKFDSLRDIIDISGDGKNRYCPSVRYAREEALKRGMTINGLPIVDEEKDVVDYYRKEVIAGPGSFVEVAENYEDFPRAIRKKLIQEIAQR